MATMQKITTYLWFNGNAEDAVEHYTSIFAKSKVTKVSRWGKGGPGPEGSVMNIAFELAGQGFIALNGGPQFTFTPAISLFVSCEDQEEVDSIWAKFLTAGGKATACGWLEDKFGMSWQIIPTALMDLMSDPDPQKAGRVAQALMQMKKIDVAALKRAHAGGKRLALEPGENTDEILADDAHSRRRSLPNLPLAQERHPGSHHLHDGLREEAVGGR